MEILKVTVLIAALRCLHASELCLVGDFDGQFSYILQNEVLTETQLSNLAAVCHHMENILNTHWPGTVVTPFGSVETGLALKTSDVDCFALVPRNSTVSDEYIILETNKLLLRQPAIYQHVNPKIGKRVSLISFFYTAAQVHCDLSFSGVTGIEISKLFNYYVHLDDRVRSVAAFLKFWSKVHKIAGSSMLSSYRLGLMIIFYFQEKSIVPSIYSLQRDAEPLYANNWNIGFDRIPYVNTNTDSVYELLRGFFKYYNEFNFDDYMVSVYAGRPIAKSLFEDVDTVPEEFVLYKHLVRKYSIEPVELSNFWIQDTFQHNLNLGRRRDPRLFSKLRSHVQYAARMFDELPRDEVLRAILVDHESSDPQQIKTIDVDTVSAHRDCARA